jgi:hypothetical protein
MWNLKKNMITDPHLLFMEIQQYLDICGSTRKIIASADLCGKGDSALFKEDIYSNLPANK